MEKKEFAVASKFKGYRLDKFLAALHQEFSRAYIQRLIQEGNILVNGAQVKSSYKVQENDWIQLKLPEPKETEIPAVAMALDIIYEDEDIIVLNKPAGLVVHPVPGNYTQTLVNGLLAYTNELSGINGVKRPGIVHRLDKDTSGALVVAKNDQSHQGLLKQFQNRKTKKIYHTIVKGHLSYQQGKIDAPIGRSQVQRKKMTVTNKNSKPAVTYFRVLEYFQDYTYLEVKLETGRTHQIRVHLAYLGYPVLGDEKYGRKKNKLGIKRQLLHAYQLGFYHPRHGLWMEFTAPLPADFQKALAELGSE